VRGETYYHRGKGVGRPVANRGRGPTALEGAVRGNCRPTLEDRAGAWREEIKEKTGQNGEKRLKPVHALIQREAGGGGKRKVYRAGVALRAIRASIIGTRGRKTLSELRKKASWRRDFKEWPYHIRCNFFSPQRGLLPQEKAAGGEGKLARLAARTLR